MKIIEHIGKLSLLTKIHKPTKIPLKMNTNDIDNKQVKSKKDLFLERIKANNPDLNTDDEEGLYGAASDYIGGLDDYKNKRDATDKNISDRFNQDPRFAQFFLGSIQPDANPLSELLKVYGEDLKTYLDDPDNAEELAKGQKEYLDKIAKGKEFEDSYTKNLDESLARLDEYQASKGLTDEQVDEVINSLADDAQNIIMGIFTPDLIDGKLKSMNYDKDVVVAKEEGAIEAANKKIDAHKKATKANENIPPVLVSKRGSVRPKGSDVVGAMEDVNNKYDFMKDAKRTPVRRNR